MSFARIAGAALLLFAFALPVAAQPPAPGEVQLGPRAAPTAQVQMGTLPVMDTTPTFDAEKATDRYLAKVSGAARAKSDAYFEGGYELEILDLIYALVVAGLLLWLQISTRIRDWAEDHTRSLIYQVMIYVVAYLVIVTVASFPLTLYESFLREHA